MEMKGYREPYCEGCEEFRIFRFWRKHPKGDCEIRLGIEWSWMGYHELVLEFHLILWYFAIAYKKRKYWGKYDDRK